MEAINTQRMLSLIYLGGRLHDLCEYLGGFRNQAWTDLVFGCGEIIAGQLSLVRRIHFDDDYETFVLAQVWDARLPAAERTWEFALFFNHAGNAWVPEVIWHWSTKPSWAEVGAVVEAFNRGRR